MTRTAGGWHMLPKDFPPYRPSMVQADGAYERTQFKDKAFLDFVIEVVRRIDKEPRFKVQPRRWVVERTFGWLTRWRRSSETTNNASTSPRP